jgi:hypothetical protein
VARDRDGADLARLGRHGEADGREAFGAADAVALDQTRRRAPISVSRWRR